MKTIKYLILMILLIGCGFENDIEISKQIDQVILKVNESEVYKNHNHKKDLFSYYLPKDIGLVNANKISSVILVDNYEIFMALNVSEVMNDELEAIDYDKFDFVYKNEFETVNNKNEKVNNKLAVEKLDEDQYLLFLKVNEVFLVSEVPGAGIPRILEEMLLVSRSVVIDKKQVVNEFSNKEEMNFEKEVIELFSESVPEDGFLRDIYESDKEDD